MTNTITNTQNLVGRFFISQWGYEQTNIDFYKVVKATAKSVYVTKVKTIRKDIDSWNYEATPSDEHDDIWVRCGREKEVMRKKLLTCTRDPAIDLDFSLGYLWDGEPCEGSCGY